MDVSSTPLDELVGPVEQLRASFAGGPERVPIRYRARPA